MSLDRWKEEKKNRSKKQSDQTYNVPNNTNRGMNNNFSNKPSHRISPRGG